MSRLSIGQASLLASGQLAVQVFARDLVDVKNLKWYKGPKALDVSSELRIQPHPYSVGCWPGSNKFFFCSTDSFLSEKSQQSSNPQARAAAR